MGVAAWFRALHIRERYIRAQLLWQQEMQQRVHRLEMRQRELIDEVTNLEARLDKAQSRRNGALGGRPPKGGQPPTPLAEIPHGDKAALRRAMGVVPGRPFHHQE